MMILRHALAAAALAAMMSAGPAAARDIVDIEPDYDPSIVWFDFPTLTFGNRGRVRLVSADGEADAALDVNEYYFYQLKYREALNHLMMRTTQTRAEPLARRRAFIETFREYPDIKVNVAGARLVEIDDTLRLVPAGFIPRREDTANPVRPRGPDPIVTPRR